MRLIAASAICLAAAACQERMPLNRAEAAAAAQNWCIREAKPWGDPVDVAKPGAGDDRGRTFWTVRFAAPAGESRILLVDAASGWTKRAP